MPTPSDADDETIVVKITGQGIDLERRLAIEALPRLMAFLLGRDVAYEMPGTARHTRQTPPMSPRLHVGAMERPVGVVEYLRDKRPQTSSDAILVLAGFLELHENRRPFSRDDIRRMIRAARLPEPANLPRDVGVAVAKGYIQPLGDGFQLTNSGLDLVGQPGPLLAPRSRLSSRSKRAGQGRDDRET